MDWGARRDKKSRSGLDGFSPVAREECGHEAVHAFATQSSTCHIMWDQRCCAW